MEKQREKEFLGELRRIKMGLSTVESTVPLRGYDFLGINTEERLLFVRLACFARVTVFKSFETEILSRKDPSDRVLFYTSGVV